MTAIPSSSPHPPNLENVRADHDATMSVWSQLVDTRFRLLAIAPIATGIGIDKADSATVAVVGLVAALGVVGYEMRNSQLHDNAIHRLKSLERFLGLPSSVSAVQHGGALTDTRSTGQVRTLGGVKVVHDRAMGVVYGGVVGAWAARLTDVVGKRWWHGRPLQWSTLGTGIAFGLAVFSAILRTSHRGRAVAPLTHLGEPDFAAVSAATIPDTLNDALRAATRNKRVPLSSGLQLAEQLRLTENRPSLLTHRRVAAPESQWWVTQPVAEGAIRRRVIPWRGRGVVHVRQSQVVRPRLTPWGELCLASAPPRSPAAESRIAQLSKHLQSRVEGLAAVTTSLRQHEANSNEEWTSRSSIATVESDRDPELDLRLALLEWIGAVERRSPSAGEEFRLVQRSDRRPQTFSRAPAVSLDIVLAVIESSPSTDEGSSATSATAATIKPETADHQDAAAADREWATSPTTPVS